MSLTVKSLPEEIRTAREATVVESRRSFETIIELYHGYKSNRQCLESSLRILQSVIASNYDYFFPRKLCLNSSWNLSRDSANFYSQHSS